MSRAPADSTVPAAGNTVPAPTRRVSHRAGLLLFLCALAAFATFDAGAKYMIARYPPPFLNLMRYVAVAAVALVWLLRRRDLSPWRSPHKGLLLTRGILLGIVGTCFMTALTWMPLSEATAIYFTSPLIMVALSPWLLGERVGAVQWLAVMGGFAGMLLIVRPGGDLPWFGTLLMVVAAIGYAFFQLLTRRLAGKVPGHVQFGYTAAVCLIAAALSAPFFPPPAWPDTPEMLALAALGLCNGIAQVLLIAAFQRVAASTLAPLNYVQLLMAVAYSTFWFDRAPDTIAGMGIALIAAAGIFLAMPRRAASADRPSHLPATD